MNLNQSKKIGTTFKKKDWRERIQFSVSFVTRMPGSTESSISSLGDCEVLANIVRIVKKN